MNKSSLILIGAGGHAHACIDVIEQHGKFSIAGLVGTREEMNALHLRYAVFATDADLAQLANDHHYALITVGQIHSPDTRIRLYSQAAALGFSLPSIIAPTAYVSSHASIGAGTIVMHGAIVNAGARVGENCIINSRALIEHDALVEDHCHISTGAILNGRVRVGAGSFVGSGCVVKDGIVLGKNCVVGMGVRVRHDQADNSKFVGDDIP
jgi:sugar O-acyltransferase (sialic acid O-acetyltransferase NeuD family)